MIIYVATLVVIVVIMLALIAVFSKKLLSAIIASGFVSLGVSGLFFFLQAPDVAITEAAIGAGLSTAIFIIALKKVKKGESKDEE
ncbi:hydrogenase subunit MbhD domain-containing protein [Mesoaciditoga sp.]